LKYATGLDRADLLALLAKFHLRQDVSHYPIAETYLTEAIAIQESVGVGSTKEVADLYTELGRCYKLLDTSKLMARGRGGQEEVTRDDRILKVFRLSLDIYLRIERSTHPRVMRAKVEVANLLRLDNRFDEAAELFKEVLEAAEFLGDAEGKIGALFNLATVSEAQGDIDGALRDLKKALEICRREYGDGGLEQIALLSNLSRLKEKQELFKEALEYATKAKDVFEAKKHQGSDYEQAAEAVFRLAQKTSASTSVK